jgi:hypothetical protein
MVREEKRKKQRKPLQRRVWIDLADGAPVIECALGNMSDTGAKLVFPNAVGKLPSQFVLLLAKDGQVARKCRLAWKEGDEIGVEFIARRVDTLVRASRVAAER